MVNQRKKESIIIDTSGGEDCADALQKYIDGEAELFDKCGNKLERLDGCKLRISKTLIFNKPGSELNIWGD